MTGAGGDDEVGPTPGDEGHRATERFLGGFNSRDATRWASTLQYPHVRSSPSGLSDIAHTPEAYAATVDFDRVAASGWNESRWVDRRVVHAAPDVVHVAGTYRRHDAGGRVLLENQVLYVVTRPDGGWGVQARFGIDPAVDATASGAEEDAAAADAGSEPETVVAALADAAARVGAVADLVHLPVAAVGPGRVDLVRTPTGVAVALPPGRVGDVRTVQVGPTAANVVARFVAAEPAGVAFHVVRRDGRWGVAALSVAHPEGQHA